MAHSSTSCAATEGKYRLAGKVAGIDACQLVSDCDEVIVGSALTCDLVVTDPLVPRRAFRLRRRRDHFEAEQDCKTYWILECFPGSRVFVNNDLVHRAHVNIGDIISLGCHQLQFTVADSEARNSESNTKIDDLCDRLIRNGELPPGYLEGCPSWANRRRTRFAVICATILVFLIGVAALFTPREEKFIQVQQPMEVVVLSPPSPDALPGDMLPTGQRKTSPQPPSVRSLDHVERKTLDQPDTPATPGNLLPNQAPAVNALDTKTVDTTVPEQMAKPAAPQFDHPDVNQSALPPVAMAPDNNPQAAVSREYVKLDSGSQNRRLSVTEASDPAMQKELGQEGVKIDSSSFARADSAATTPMTDGPVTRNLAKPSDVQLAANHDVGQSSLLPAVAIAHGDTPQAGVNRAYTKLDSTVETRRLSVAEASNPIMQKELGRAGVKIDSNTFASADSAAATSMNQWSGGSVTRSLAKPGAVQIASNRGEDLKALAAYNPSPLSYKTEGDVQIPIARLPGALNPTGIDDPNAAEHGKTTGAVTMKGDVTDAEIAVSWKSGQFHTHAPGKPPLADPATFCYVGKTEKDGKQFLYILFTCNDPNLDQLITNHNTGDVELTQDDGVEIFLATDSNMRHYHQIIVNARGNWWSSEVQNQGAGKYSIGPAWNAQPELITTVNKAAGHWTCKLLVPFDRLGGVPAKGSTWRVNFCRNFRGQSSDDSHLQTWFSVYDKIRNFHNPERFGIFEW